MNNRQIIDSALRRLGVLGSHGQTASPYDQVEALHSLASIFKSFISMGTLGSLKDVVPFGTGATSYTAHENERVYRNSDDPGQTVTLPDLVTDHCGNERPVRDLAVVSIQDRQSGNSVDYIFDGGRKAWFPIDDLAQADASDTTGLTGLLDQECPLSNRDSAGLAALLAEYLADAFGSQIPAATQRLAQNFILSLTHNYSERRDEHKHHRWGDYGRFY